MQRTEAAAQVHVRPFSRHRSAVPITRRAWAPAVLATTVATTVAMWGLGSTCLGAELRFAVTDSDGAGLPCRIHLRDASGMPVAAKGLPFWNDHFVCDGAAVLHVPPDEYSWQIERGPEYRRAAGTVRVEAERRATVNQQLERVSLLRDAGWFSGDLHIHRPAADIELLMLAEDLNFAPVITWWNTPAPDTTAYGKTEFRIDAGHVYCIGAGEDEREGGALLYFGLQKPLDLSTRSREFPSPMHFVKGARRLNPDVWIDIEKPFWWDVPTWLASGQMNSIGIANNHMNRAGMLEGEAWGRPRDVSRLPNPLGNGYWTQEIYYHILNCGIRLPPSAGSASGVLKNPVGYNRVYVHLGAEPLTRDAWFAALKRGECFVTNGPLLRVTTNGLRPGKVFALPEDGSLKLNLEMVLTSNDVVPAVEVIHNGRIVERVICAEQVTQELSTSLTIREPGWFLVRAIADVDSTFRFASTGPWYVQGADGDGRISKRSAQFFLDWVEERINRVRRNVGDAAELREVLEPHERARVYWAQRVEAANAE